MSGFDLNEATILLIDDDSNNLAILADFLSTRNYIILVAETGESGLKRAIYVRPDIILLDLMMPGMGGLEVCRRLKKEEITKDIPVIFMTALAETEFKVSGFEAGAVDYITKPFHREEVLARVGAHLHLRELAHQLQDANQFLEKRVEQRTVELAKANKKLQLEITERKRVEQERDKFLMQEQKARIEAEKSIQLRDDFLAIASHELRTPLTPLHMQVQFIKRHLRSAPLSFFPKIGALLKAVENTDREIDQLSRLIENLLDVSRITVGQLTLNPEKVELSQLLRDTIDRFRADCKKAGCEFILKIETQVSCFLDPYRIKQLVTNLLTNAIKYGAGKPIEVSLSSDQVSVLLTVRDHGIGISKQEQSKLFQRFERFAPLKHFGGLGLGLYIVRRIVDANDGIVRLESEVGKGTTVMIELPRYRLNANQAKESKFLEG